MGLSSEIAELIASTSDRDIPTEAFSITKNCVLDTIGVALAGFVQLESKRAEQGPLLRPLRQEP